MDQDTFIGQVICGDQDAVREALRDTPELANARSDGIGSTPLHFSSHRGFVGIVEALLAAGADVHAREAASDSVPLHWAAEGGHPMVVDLLLGAGSDLSADDGWFGLTPLGWATVVVWAPPFHDDRPAATARLLAAGAEHDVWSAVATGDVERVRTLAKEPAALAARLGFVLESMTPLHLAIARRLPDMVALLVTLGADLDARTSFGLTSLALALRCGAADLADRLRAAGARDDASSALVAGDRKALALALSRTDPAQLDPLVLVAAAKGDSRAVALLIDQGASPNASIHHLIGELPARVTALHRAAEGGHAEAARALLDAGAPVDAGREDEMATPLHLAAGDGHLAMVELLLQRGADPQAIERGYGATALDWAEHGENEEVTALLESAAGLSA